MLLFLIAWIQQPSPNVDCPPREDRDRDGKCNIAGIQGASFLHCFIVAGLFPLHAKSQMITKHHLNVPRLQDEPSSPKLGHDCVR